MKSIWIFLTCAATLSYGAVVNISNSTAIPEGGFINVRNIIDGVQDDSGSVANSIVPLREINEISDANTKSSSPDANVPNILEEVQDGNENVTYSILPLDETNEMTSSSPDAEVTKSLIRLPFHDTNDTEINFSNITYLPQTDFNNETRCPPLFLPCNDGTCVFFYLFCDQQPHCPDGSDENTTYCHQGAPVVICADGQQMLKGHDVRCDGLEDCNDGSDESGCFTTNNDNHTTFLKPCSWEYQFQCSEGTCIDKSQVCDGTIDCPLGVDETLPQCALQKFFNNPDRNQLNQNDLRYQQAYQCNNGDILIGNSNIVCDGTEDCSDGSDEQNCGDKYYVCDNGQLITSYKDIRCDGQAECSDSSDETNPSCGMQEEIEGTSHSDKQKLRTYVIIMITVAVFALALLAIIIYQARLVCSLRKTLLEREKKRAIVLTHATPPPSYSEVTAGNTSS